MNPQTSARIMKELKNQMQKPVTYMDLRADPDSILNIHFTFLGPPDSPYANGLYHGVIMLSPEYPLKPPNIQFLSHNGRFELHKNICTTFTAWHPESWLPTWNLTNIVIALRSMMEEEMPGAVAALSCTPEARKQYAVQSKSFKCKCCGLELKDLNLFDEQQCEKKSTQDSKLESSVPLIKVEQADSIQQSIDSIQIDEQIKVNDFESKEETKLDNVQAEIQSQPIQNVVQTKPELSIIQQSQPSDMVQPDASQPSQSLRRKLMYAMVKKAYDQRQCVKNK